ncbi:MAG: ergothioneine biosynthesis protein EgtB [Rubrobacteraceae bacterium]
MSKKAIVQKLEEARKRTRLLLDPVSDEDLGVQHDPIMSPLVWDYGHIGNYEELWLLNRAFGISLSDRAFYDIYDASVHPREERPSLNLLDRTDAGLYLDAVRKAAIEALDGADLGSDPLLKAGFVYNMILQHEIQHNETMLQTLQLMPSRRYKPEPLVETPSAGEPYGEMVFVPGGSFVMGTDDYAVLDNERDAHEVPVPDFHIDRVPVTNRAYLEFVEDGGYRREELWEPDGWAWIQDQNISLPKHWYQPEPHNWWTQRFGYDEPLRLDHPVVHVCWYEADAFARWAGKRLPTEAEWEKTASWDPETESKRLFPWGGEAPTTENANLDQLAFGTSPAGAYPAGASPYGALDMIGNVWEWTATDFTGYPGFEAFPYREYSEVFLNQGYPVLRGGSWATRPAAIRNTFRNWDLPIRRQLFVGFRCAK